MTRFFDSPRKWVCFGTAMLGGASAYLLYHIAVSLMNQATSFAGVIAGLVTVLAIIACLVCAFAIGLVVVSIVYMVEPRKNEEG